MDEKPIAGSCLCGEVRFEVKPPFTAFRYCYCSRCRKASGAAHAANIVVPYSQLTWTAGESLIHRFNLPGAKRFAVCFCTKCGTRVPHKIPTLESYLVPAGVLDKKVDARPEHSIYWQSRADWYVEPAVHTKFDEYAK